MTKKNWKPFEAARDYIQQLGLKNRRAFNTWSQTSQRPADIPTRPDKAYQGKGWQNWRDWLKK